jgi:hypothetical protein
MSQAASRHSIAQRLNDMLLPNNIFPAVGPPFTIKCLSHSSSVSESPAAVNQADYFFTRNQARAVAFWGRSHSAGKPAVSIFQDCYKRYQLESLTKILFEV